MTNFAEAKTSESSTMQDSIRSGNNDSFIHKEIGIIKQMALNMAIPDSYDVFLCLCLKIGPYRQFSNVLDSSNT